MKLVQTHRMPGESAIRIFCTLILTSGAFACVSEGDAISETQSNSVPPDGEVGVREENHEQTTVRNEAEGETASADSSVPQVDSSSEPRVDSSNKLVPVYVAASWQLYKDTKRVNARFFSSDPRERIGAYSCDTPHEPISNYSMANPIADERCFARKPIFHMFAEPGAHRHALYRCREGNKYFISRDLDCENQSFEGLIGYAVDTHERAHVDCGSFPSLRGNPGRRLERAYSRSAQQEYSHHIVGTGLRSKFRAPRSHNSWDWEMQEPLGYVCF